MATHTPIPYWLSLRWAETRAWSETVVQIQSEDSEPPKGDR
jgi:hypothetical protein